MSLRPCLKTLMKQRPLRVVVESCPHQGGEVPDEERLELGASPHREPEETGP